MRVLFTTQPLSGHVHPLLPFAHALAEAGHVVAFATHATLATTIIRAGFRHFPAGLDWASNDRLPEFRTLPFGPERTAFIRREVFAGLRPRHLLPDLLAVAADWSPDLIVHDEREYGGGLAGEILGLPHAAVGILATGDFIPRPPIVAALDAHRTGHGLPPDPDLAMLDRYLTLRPFPPSFQAPGLAVAPTTHYLRPLLGDRTGTEALPPWVEDRPGQPLVYAGLGTQHPPPALFRAIIAGLAEEALTLVVTVGRDQDPADYGPQPQNVHIERYIPLSLLLPRCDAVVNNGGSGTLMAALAQGLPLVILSLTADQPENAARCAALGVGIALGREERTPVHIRDAVRAVLADPSYRTNAGHLRDEMAALPGPEYAVALLERLAREKQPIVAAG